MEELGSEMPIVEDRSDLANELADLTSIILDLRFVIDAGRELVRQAAEGRRDGVVARALWSASLVAYARCFKTGVRRTLDTAFLDELDGEPWEFHRWLLDVRDKHLAHSVSGLEQVAIGLVLSPESSSDRTVEGVSILQLVRVGELAETVPQIVMLGMEAAKSAEAQLAELQASLLADAQELPFDEVAARPGAGLVAPGVDDAGRRR